MTSLALLRHHFRSEPPPSLTVELNPCLLLPSPQHGAEFWSNTGWNICSDRARVRASCSCSFQSPPKERGPDLIASLPFLPILSGSFLQSWLYKNPSCSLQLAFSDNCSKCRCIFLCVCWRRWNPHPATPPSQSPLWNIMLNSRNDSGNVFRYPSCIIRILLKV